MDSHSIEDRMPFLQSQRNDNDNNNNNGNEYEYDYLKENQNENLMPPGESFEPEENEVHEIPIQQVCFSLENNKVCGLNWWKEMLKYIKIVFFHSYFNILLILFPFALAAEYADWGDGWVFAFCLFTMAPLAALLSFGTEELALHSSPAIGGFLNITFGNAVELIIAVIALNKEQYDVVKSSLIGSMLNTLLFISGFSFLIGGIRYPVQSFNRTIIRTNSGLLMIAVLTIAIPAIFNLTDSKDDTNSTLLALSHAASLINFIIYILFLIFQLKTHSSLFESQNEIEQPKLPVASAVLLLASITLILAYLAELLVDSIEATAEAWGIPKEFIGVILLPLVSNSPELLTAAAASARNKMDLSVGVFIGSTTQIAIVAIPICCIMGWILGKPLTLDFRAFDTAVLFLSVLIVAFLVSDGKSHWLEGCVLLLAYIIIGIAFFYHDEFSKFDLKSSVNLIPAIGIMQLHDT
eukprot:TRINITY_DN182_c1_g1_i1.p1 TRINITY_DN182_c1_g1~~TRINITY_DN182_c1_g1_i1.p1  ORF type:complete len:474 (-),score=177.30 TRINITY_DN182_c1_g1_i1:1000-2397(-)